MVQAPQVQLDSVAEEHAVELERLPAPRLGRLADSVAEEHAVERQQLDLNKQTDIILFEFPVT